MRKYLITFQLLSIFLLQTASSRNIQISTTNINTNTSPSTVSSYSNMQLNNIFLFGLAASFYGMCFLASLARLPLISCRNRLRGHS